MILQISGHSDLRKICGCMGVGCVGVGCVGWGLVWGWDLLVFVCSVVVSLQLVNQSLLTRVYFWYQILRNIDRTKHSHHLVRESHCSRGMVVDSIVYLISGKQCSVLQCTAGYCISPHCSAVDHSTQPCYNTAVLTFGSPHTSINWANYCSN